MEAVQNVFKSKEQKLRDVLLDMKMAKKSMERQAKKRGEASKNSRKQVEKYMKEGQIEAAKIHAESALRQEKEQQSYSQLAGRLDAVSQKVQTALNQQMMSKQMSKVVKGMSAVLKGMDAEKITKVMDKFEQNSEDLDVAQGYMEKTIEGATTGAGAEMSVNGLLQETADSIGLEISLELDEAVPLVAPVKAQVQETEERKAVKEV
mmetsp:Transcript_13226/g.16468  ORF Transcript_13226/g.16468 Transcript_13226/m.16468 type:complete len:206 (+) Transcript_13226:280-897(+)